MAVKKVVIFGATGSTGIVTTDTAIKKGYDVTAFVRDESKLGDVKPSAVVKGDVLNIDDVEKAVKGQDAVVIVLGTRNDLSPTTVLSTGTKNILRAMKANNVKRVSCCISSFLFWDRNSVPKPYAAITEDHARMLDALKSSDREWVAVLPPHISDEPARGDYVLKNDEPVGRVIAKQDLADILLKCIVTDEHVGHAVGMGYVDPK